MSIQPARIVQQALASGIDSISAGLSKAVEAGGLSAIQDNIQAFAQEGFKSFDPAGLKGFSEIAGPGYLAPPAAFFNKLASIPSALSGKFQAAEISSKLEDTSLNSKSQVDNIIQTLEENLAGVGDDAQLANVDLQNVMQKQQQMMQMLSNISKLFHDSAMSMIRKLGG